MMTRPPAAPPSALVDSPIAPRWLAIVEVALIFAVIFLHGAWPVPDVNEAHYLSKAKHYWDPTWCANDFFVKTADAHQVFYWTFGWLTRYVPLDRVAWLGRFLTWGLLAWAWRRLSWAIVPRAWLAVLGAELFVMLNENAHMAGEWVVGGIEAKGFAYVLVFLGLEAVVRRQWNRAWLLFGGASCFHVIVGGWAALAAGLAWLTDGRDRPSIRAMLPGLIGALVLALPGLWFALSLTHGVSAETVREANAIYVWQRLPHHLSADRFREGFPSRHLVLWGLWLVLVTVAPASNGEKRFHWFVSAAMLLTLIGYGLVWLSNWEPEQAAALLRFYWFRASDVFVPLGVSLTGLRFVDQLGQTRPNRPAILVGGSYRNRRLRSGDAGPTFAFESRRFRRCRRRAARRQEHPLRRLAASLRLDQGPHRPARLLFHATDGRHAPLVCRPGGGRELERHPARFGGHRRMVEADLRDSHARQRQSRVDRPHARRPDTGQAEFAEIRRFPRPTRPRPTQ